MGVENMDRDKMGMENQKSITNQKRITCRIIEDLLPLYVDDSCSEDSRNLVESHLKDCESCRRVRTAMAADLEFSTEEERKKEDRRKADAYPVEKAMKKVRRRVFAGFLAMTVVFLFFVLTLGSSIGEGYAWGSISKIGQTRSLLKSWKDDGAEAMLDKMDVHDVYRYLSGNDYDRKQSEAYRFEKDRYTETRIGDSVYMLAFDLENELQTVAGYDDYKTSGKEEDFWHDYFLMNIEKGFSGVIIEEAYSQLMKGDTETRNRLTEMNLTRWDTEYGVCYTDSSFKENRWDDIEIYFRRTILEKEKRLNTIEPVYWAARNSEILTPELYQLCIDTDQMIFECTGEFASYYTVMGYNGFREQWKQELNEILKNEKIVIDNFSFEGAHRIHNADSPFYSEVTWQARWKIQTVDGRELHLAFDTGTDVMRMEYIYVLEDGCTVPLWSQEY